MSDQTHGDDNRRRPELNGRFHGSDFLRKSLAANGHDGEPALTQRKARSSGHSKPASSRQQPVGRPCRAASQLAAKLYRAQYEPLPCFPRADREIASFVGLPPAEGTERAERWAKAAWGSDSVRARLFSLAGRAKREAAHAIAQHSEHISELTPRANGPETIDRLVRDGYAVPSKKNWHLWLVLTLFVVMFLGVLGFDLFALANLAATTGDPFTEGMARGLALTIGVSLCAFVGGTLFLACRPAAELPNYLRPFSLVVFVVGLIANIYFNAQLGYSHAFDLTTGEVPPPLPANWMCGVAGGIMGLVLVSLEYLVKETFQKLLPRENVKNLDAAKAVRERSQRQCEMSQWRSVDGLADDLLKRLIADRSAHVESFMGLIRKQQNDHAVHRKRLELEVEIANNQNQLRLLNDAAEAESASQRPKATIPMLFSLLLLMPASAPAASPPPAGRETFCIVARLDDPLLQSVRREIVKRIGDAEPGDLLHIIVAPRLIHVATFIVPQSTGAARLREHSLRKPLAALTQLAERPPSPEEQQLSLPEIAAVIQSFRHTVSPPHVILAGDPIYHDPRQGAWSMIGGVVPADGSLNNKLSPFHAGVVDFPKGTTVAWLTPSANWGSDHAHRSEVIRFYRLFLSKHQADLVRVTSDPAAAFAFALGGPSQFAGKVTPLQDGDGMKAVWIRSKRQFVPADTEGAISLAPSDADETRPTEPGNK